jgi:hypothetical protein
MIQNKQTDELILVTVVKDVITTDKLTEAMTLGTVFHPAIKVRRKEMNPKTRRHKFSQYFFFLIVVVRVPSNVSKEVQEQLVVEAKNRLVGYYQEAANAGVCTTRVFEDKI